MSEPFLIFIDRLQDGNVQNINTVLTPEFFEIQEEELFFQDPVYVSGEAYLAEKELILHLNAATEAHMPCAICNRMTPISLTIKGYYHTEPLKQIEGALFNPKNIIREILLLELPKVAECKNGCVERQLLAPYLRRESSIQDQGSETYFPFADLDTECDSKIVPTDNF